MTICNMSIEGARVGYVNPDDNVESVKGDHRQPATAARRAWWQWMASRSRCVVQRRCGDEGRVTSAVTWGVNPGQSIGVDGRVPAPENTGNDRKAVTDALDYMGLVRVADRRNESGHRRRWAHANSRLRPARGRSRRTGPACAAREGSRHPARCRSVARQRRKARRIFPQVEGMETIDGCRLWRRRCVPDQLWFSA